jgi:NADPH:quinone reductase-like Zn-dependent oxidoreductase
MRAVVHDRYGPPEVLRLAELPRPSPRDGEVLVRVRATTVNRTDCGFRNPRPVFVRLFSGLVAPRRQILGTEFGGTIEAVGAAVMQFAPGDRVFGVNADRFGTQAEFVCVRESAPLAKLPNGISFDEGAAACDGAILALTCLRWARLKRGQRILV